MKRLIPFVLILLTSCSNAKYYQSPIRETEDKIEGGVTFYWGDKPPKPRKVSEKEKIRNTVKWVKKNRKDFKIVSKPSKKKKKNGKNSVPSNSDSTSK